jgi:hypothetical protein
MILDRPTMRSSAAQMARLLFTRARELIRSQPLILGVLVIWAFAPLVSLLVYVSVHGGVLTGANGSDSFDQAAYLAWVRDGGSHVFASDLWQTGPTAHDYLHPMFVISGLLWRLGLPIQAAYLIWKPVAVLVLFLGFAAYVRHLLPDRRGQTAALVLGLFYLSPGLAFAQWTDRVSVAHRLTLVLSTDDAYSALNLWGFEHTAITIGLMPVFLLAVERSLAAFDASERGRGWTALAAIAGLLVSWLHPWQGVMLLAVAAGMLALKPPRRRYRALLVPAAATALPLLYGFLLSHYDLVWRTFQARTIGVAPGPWWALLASFGPLAVFAVLGVRRPRQDRDWMLLLWLAACAAVYFFVPEFPPHSLSGVTLPLAVLAVRGWQRARSWERFRISPRLATALAVAAIVVVTVPGAEYHVQTSAEMFGNSLNDVASRQLELLSDDQAAALAYIDHSPRPGSVLASEFLSMSVPEFTGREVYAGHPMWQPLNHDSVAALFFSLTLKDPSGAFRRGILRETKATFVIGDCGAPASLATAIAPIARVAKRFGCVTVYETT